MADMQMFSDAARVQRQRADADARAFESLPLCHGSCGRCSPPLFDLGGAALCETGACLHRLVSDALELVALQPAQCCKRAEQDAEEDCRLAPGDVCNGVDGLARIAARQRVRHVVEAISRFRDRTRKLWQVLFDLACEVAEP